MSLANCSSGIVRGADSWLSIGVDLPARRRGFRRISRRSTICCWFEADAKPASAHRSRQRVEFFWIGLDDTGVKTTSIVAGDQPRAVRLPSPMPFPQVSPRGRSELLARDGHGGEAPLVRRHLIVDGFDRDLDRLCTDGDVDLDRCVSEVHLMAAAIVAANDREAHLVYPLALSSPATP
jgi:hypothetical protein